MQDWAHAAIFDAGVKGLRTVFDASTVSFDFLIPVLVPLSAFAVTIWLYKSSSKRTYWKIGVGITILFVAVALVFPWLDYHRVQHRLASGAVETKMGYVSGHRRWTERRFTGSSKGVGVTSTHRYTTTTYETFYIGDRFFSFIAGGYPSGASFTNSADPPVNIEDGMLARATYFADNWNDGGLRIVRLELGRPPPDPIVPMIVERVNRSDLHPEFTDLLFRLEAAVKKGDAVALRTMVEFPFRFGGHTLEANDFDTLSMSLFSGPLRQCLVTGTVRRFTEKVGQQSHSLSFGTYFYGFIRTPAGWKLMEFGADGEAM